MIASGASLTGPYVSNVTFLLKGLTGPHVSNVKFCLKDLSGSVSNVTFLLNLRHFGPCVSNVTLEASIQ